MDALVPEIVEQGHATTEQLSALLDNRAEPAELPFLTGHLLDCDHCTQSFNGLRAVRDLLRHMPIEAPPRSFTLPVRQPVVRFRRLIPITRALSAIAAIFCVLLFSADAMGTTFDSAPLPKVSPANQVPNRVAATAPTGAPQAASGAAAGSAAAPAAPKAPAPAAAAPPPPAAAFAPRSDAGAATSPSAQEARRAEGPINSPSGGGASAAAAKPAEPTVTSMAATTPSSLQAIPTSGRSVVTDQQDTSTFELTPLRAASLILGLLAVGLFIASVMLRRVALAPVDGGRDGLDGLHRPRA